MQQFNLTHATCLDVKEEHYCLPVGKRIYYRWVHDKDQAMIDFLHPKNTHWVQTIIAGSLFRAMYASGPPSNVGMVTRGETKRVRITNESAKRYEGRNGTVALSSMKNPQMGPGYKQLEVGYDDPTGDDFLVGVN